MATRSAMRKRVEKLEARQTGSSVVSMLVEGPEGEVWLTLADGRQFDGGEAREMLGKVTFAEHGGYCHLVDIDLDLALGREPHPEERLRAEDVGEARG